jgi:hypothetical protein
VPAAGVAGCAGELQTILIKRFTHNFLLQKKKSLLTRRRLLGSAGFEPAKLAQQIYSLPPLTARETPQFH